MSREKKNKRERKKEQSLDIIGIGSVFFRTIKLMTDFFYVVILLFAMLGTGLAFGYLASQVESVKVPSKDSMVSQVESVSMISQLTYSDKSLISKINTDLLRTPVSKEAISDNVKQAIVATEDENFNKHKGVVPKAVFRATLASILGLG